MKKIKLHGCVGGTIIRVDDIKEVNDLMKANSKDMSSYFNVMSLNAELKGVEGFKPYQIKIDSDTAKAIVDKMFYKVKRGYDKTLNIDAVSLGLLTRSGSIRDLIRLVVEE